MTISKDLFLSILAMDSYNRGYDAGITGLGGAGSKIGSATTGQDAEQLLAPSSAVAAGFYAVAYNTPYGQVISYRGTDNLTVLGLDGSDNWHGWTFGAGFGTNQIDLAQAVYEAATHTDVFSSDGNAILTGHSLGGALAGLVAKLKTRSCSADRHPIPGYQIPDVHGTCIDFK